MRTNMQIAIDDSRTDATAVSGRGSTPSRRLDGVWRIDPMRSSVQFQVGHFWGLHTVSGRFDSYRGTLNLSADPAVELTIDAGSLATGNDKRDRHLRSADFFDVDEHPHVRFVSDSASFAGRTLTLRGQLHAGGGQIPLDVEGRIREVGDEFEVDAAVAAPHRELGMTWNKLGMIGRRSLLTVTGRLTRELPERRLHN